MLMPSIFGENFMDDFFGVPERTYTQSAQNALMKTDVVENKDLTYPLTCRDSKKKM